MPTPGPPRDDGDAASGMPGYRASTYGDGFADVYDDWYTDVSPPDATARFLADRTSGPVLELGSGTGRLAGPLLDAGVPVIGLDASIPMLERSRRQHARVPVVAGDMAELPVQPGRVGAVLVAFNTLFNLATVAGQRRCLAEARRALAPEGIVVVEAFVPADLSDQAVDHIDVVRLDADLLVLRVSRTDPTWRTVAGHHVELRDGQPVRLRPWNVRFSSPEELDRLAVAAGLDLAERFEDWDGTPFGDDSPAHVSVYRAARG